jgi:hypothetical protein
MRIELDWVALCALLGVLFGSLLGTLWAVLLLEILVFVGLYRR